MAESVTRMLPLHEHCLLAPGAHTWVCPASIPRPHALIVLVTPAALRSLGSRRCRAPARENGTPHELDHFPVEVFGYVVSVEEYCGPYEPVGGPLEDRGPDGGEETHVDQNDLYAVSRAKRQECSMVKAHDLAVDESRGSNPYGRHPNRPHPDQNVCEEEEAFVWLALVVFRTADDAQVRPQVGARRGLVALAA